VGDDELLGLIDRLEALLTGSELDELEVEVGETALRLRRLGAVDPQALALAMAAASGRGASGAAAVDGAAAGASGGAPDALDPDPSEGPRHHQVLAPLTGIFYSSPSPEAAPYVQAGGEVQQGQVIGLIEAMKLFNEIKSDVHGRVVRIVAENGQLIKAKQPLIEVAPA
jgi:acetyl-CoA carboxylase biotin carboxyl carrier protein